MSSASRQGGNGGCGGCLGWILGLAALGLAIEAVVWLVHATGYVLGLTPTYAQQRRYGATWVSDHYANVGWGYFLAVVVLVVGVPLAVALTRELARAPVRPQRAVAMAAFLVAIAATISLAPLRRIGP
jgi:hypothetical protein